MNEFVHLHVHSDYSILDASIAIPDLVAQAKAKGMKACALTDHGNVHGLVQFYMECQKAGIKPILGCEVYVARKSALSKMDRVAGNPTDHLVLLAKDKEGYENILELVSWAYQHGMHYVPRVDLERLQSHSKGIIALTACLSGGVNRMLRGWEYGSKEKGTYHAFSPDYAGAKELACSLRDIFGPGNFFLEVQHHAGAASNPELLEKQLALAEAAFRLGAEAQIPMIATNDIHFQSPEDAAAREIAYQIARGKLDESSAERVNHAAEFYVKSPEEMAAAFRGWPEYVLRNTLWITEQCNVQLDLEQSHFAVPIDEQGEMTPDRVKATWDHLVTQGFMARYGEHYPERQKAYERVMYEKETIEKMGFVPYFLVVADFIRYAKKQGIPVGPGRGSVGGCAVAFCLGITDLDPLGYDLIFERFLNPERISMPDIDVDFDKDRVHEVLDYVVRKYGRDRVARISAFGKMWAKQAINDVGRMLGLPQEELRVITAEIPDAQGEFRMSIEDALQEVPELQELSRSEDPRKTRLVQIAAKLEGVKRTVTTHACGIVIGNEALQKHCALMPVKDNDFGGILQSQLDMESLEKLGLLKYDFLALDTLTIIARTERLIRKRRNIDFNVAADLRREDKATYRMLSLGRTVGVFQIEKPGMRELAMLVQPQNLEDIALILALYRPGPLDAKDERGLTMVDHYVLRRSGFEEVHFHHPMMEKALKNTYGILVYQEQIMRIAQDLCGYSMAQADMLRKAVGKKKPELIKKEREKFVPAAVKNGVHEDTAARIWTEIETFARYGFNKSHAIGYAVLTYQTMYLKTHYPVEYMASCLSAACGYTEPEFRDVVPKKSKSDSKVKRLIDEANRLGLKVLPPNINLSEEECTAADDKTVRMGLCVVKGVGFNAGKVVSARNNSGNRFTDFKTFVTLCRAADIDSGSLQSLILSGSCDDLGERNQMHAGLEGNVASAKESAKYGHGIMPFVALPETFQEVHPMSAEQRNAHTLDLVGAYDVRNPAPARIIASVTDQQKLSHVAILANKHPGKIPLGIVYSPIGTNHEIYLDFGFVAGDETFIHELEQVSSVRLGNTIPA